MANFAQLTSEPRAPGKTILLEPWVFADEWASRPKETICVGLRLVSEADKNKARAEAEKIASEYHPNGGDPWVEAYEGALIRQVVAHGICDPNDVSKPCHLLRYAEEEVRIALSTPGAEHVFEQHRRYEVETSAIEPLADNDDAAELAALLTSTDIEKASAGLRRSIHNVLTRLAALSG